MAIGVSECKLDLDRKDRESLLQHGDVLEAEQTVRSLEALEKARGGSVGSAELKARVLEARGKATEALAVLKSGA